MELMKPQLGRQLRHSHPMSRHIVGCWLMNEGSGTFINDMSCNGHGGTFNGGITWVPGKNGLAIDSDGTTSEYIIIDTDFAIDTSKPFSIVSLSNVHDYAKTYPNLYTFKTDQATCLELFFSTQTNYDGINFGSNANFVRLKTATDISAELLNTWSHVVVTYNGLGRTTAANYKLYWNGVEMSTNASGGFAATANASYLLINSTLDNYQMDGQVDHIMVMDDMLYPHDVVSLYSYPYQMFEGCL